MQLSICFLETWAGPITDSLTRNIIEQFPLSRTYCRWPRSHPGCQLCHKATAFECKNSWILAEKFRLRQAFRVSSPQMWSLLPLLFSVAHGELSWRCALMARFSRPSFFGEHSELPADCYDEPRKRIGPLTPPATATPVATTTATTAASSSSSSSSLDSPLFDFASSSSLPALKVPPVVISSRTPDALTLENGFIKFTLNLQQGTIDALSGAFEGNSIYVSALSEKEPRGFRTEQASGQWEASKKSVHVASETAQNITLMLTDEQETWTVQLLSGQRVFTLKIEGKQHLRHALYTDPLAIYAFFENAGVVQMMDAPGSRNHLCSQDRLALWYAISGH